MGKALYRKYRSKSLSEIIGQEHITTTLSNALKSGRISHAYLFTGPRGVGKTSVARILAHEVNGLPYDEANNHMDIIEIDAASNRGIEDIRDLRSKVAVTPTSAKYKVYIIDEVHMLTTPAFNALLKTLEEPPEHAIFILATTEAHKLPETIVSRTQRFSFKPIDETKAVEHLKNIAKQEKIKIEDAALDLIVKHGAGSFRDSISLLDQASSTKDNISLSDVQTFLGIAPVERIEALYRTVSQGTPADLLDQLSSLFSGGFTPANVAKQLGSYLRQQIQTGSDKSSASLKLLEDLLKVPAAQDSESLLEIILLQALFDNSPEGKVAELPTEQKISEPQVEATPQPALKEEVTLVSTNVAGSEKEPWQAVLEALKGRHNTLYGILRMAKAEEKDKKLILSFAFAFHQKRMSEASNKDLIAKTVREVFGRPLIIDCQVLDKSSYPKSESKPAKEIETISNIFGNVEVVD